MAIKARASTTLASIVDVQSTCRYYLLQSSSLATPSKPTTYPPPSSWGTTEPAYQEGSTNNLYFVDCTVFSDDTFVYSEVSLSSSYEAAKIAYNTALEAQESASDALDAANTNTEDLTNFQTTIETALDGLQGQIDGSIMTWFYEYVPTNENEPASEWTTTDLKNNHLGDLFYDTITGYCYRWQVQNNEYSWQRITDVDVTKALADAAKAQDTADDKRRVFVGMTSPTPPYDVGDLWAQGSTGELMKCKTAKSSGQSYAASDWEKASKYTDDTKAEEVQGNLDVVESTVSALSTDFNVEKGKISALITKTDSIETDITNIEGDISAVETNVSNLTTGQSQLTQTVNGITQNVSEIQSEQTTINNNISGLQTSVNNLNETTSTLETNLEGISATVSQHTSTLTTVNNDITDLEDRMDTAELKITPDAIIQTVSSVYETKEDASALADRVTQAEAQIETNASQISATVSTVETNKKNSVTSVKVEYALSDSATTAPTSGWSTTAPAWVDGKYMWQKTTTTKGDGTSASTTTCIAGATGATGAKGDKGETGAKGDTGAQGKPGIDFSQGKMLHTDPNFDEGLNDCSVYNNSANDTVTVTRATKSIDNPFTDATHELVIKTSGTAIPGLGGYVQSITSRANAIFVRRIIAKIPVGCTIMYAQYAMGTGYTVEWLTSNKGTGKFAEYIYKYVCGSSGLFETGGYVYINGITATSANPVTWYVAYSTTFDMTDVSDVASAQDELDSIVEEDLVDIRESITNLTMTSDDISATVTTIEEQQEAMDDLMSQVEQITSLLIEDGKVTFDFTTIQQQVENAVEELNRRNRYVAITEDPTLGATITIGDSESGMVGRFTKTSLDFLSGDTVIASYANDGLTTENITTNNQLKFGGNWAIRPGTNGNLNDVWIGG